VNYKVNIASHLFYWNRRTSEDRQLCVHYVSGNILEMVQIKDYFVSNQNYKVVGYTALWPVKSQQFWWHLVTFNDIQLLQALS